MDDASRRDTKRLRMTDSAPTFDSLPLVAIAAFLDSTEDFCSLAATCKQALVDVEQHSKLLLDKIVALGDDCFRERVVTDDSFQERLLIDDSLQDWWETESNRIPEETSFRYRSCIALKTKLAQDNEKWIMLSPSCTRWAALDEEGKTLVVYDLGSSSSVASIARDDIPSVDAAGAPIPDREQYFGYHFVDEYHIALLFRKFTLLWNLSIDDLKKSLRFLHHGHIDSGLGLDNVFLRLQNGEFMFPIRVEERKSVEFFKFNLQSKTVEKSFTIKMSCYPLNPSFLGIAFWKFVTILNGSELCIYDLHAKEICHQEECKRLSFQPTSLDTFEGNSFCVLDRENHIIENWSVDQQSGSILKSPLCRFSRDLKIDRVLALRWGKLYVKMNFRIHVFNLARSTGICEVPMMSQCRQAFDFPVFPLSRFSFKNNICSTGYGVESKLYLLGMPKL